MDSELLMKAARVLRLEVVLVFGVAWITPKYQREHITWLRYPDGRDFVERRLVEMGYRWECHACPEDRTYTVVVSRNEGEYAEATEVTPAEALIAAVAKLPEREASK